MYRLNKDQQRIVDAAASVADSDLAPRAAAVDRDATFPKEAIAALGARGLLGLNVPKEHGGHGEGPRTIAAVLDVAAQKSFVTSAGHADGYVVSTLATDATKPIESSIYVVLNGDAGISASGTWRGLGLRGNASAPMKLDNVVVGAERALTASGKGLDMMLGVVLPLFQVGSAAVGIGIAEPAVQASIAHVTHARFEESNSSLRDLPTLRAQIARMRIETDQARAHLAAVLDSLESPGPATQLLVLEAKASGTETAVAGTELAMRTCGGAAFGGAHRIQRLFPHAPGPILMAPTSDVAYQVIGPGPCGPAGFSVF